MRFGIRQFLSDVPAMIASSHDLYQKYGIKVHTLVKAQGQEIGSMLLKNEIDLAILGDHWTIEAMSRSSKADPLVIVACIGGGGQRWRLMASNKSGILKIEDLNNKKLGSWRRSYGHHLLENIFLKNGIRPKIIKVSMDSNSAVDEFKNQSLDAIFAWEPIPSILEDQKLAHEIFNLEGHGDGVPVYIVTRKSIVKNNLIELVAILRALNDAIHLAKENGDEAAKIASSNIHVPAKILKKALERHEFKIGLTCRQRESLYDVVRIFREKNMNKLSESIAINFDDTPLKRLIDLDHNKSQFVLEENCSTSSGL